MKAVIIAILLLSTLGFAQEAEVKESADNFIISLVGEDYFNQKISFIEMVQVSPLQLPDGSRYALYEVVYSYDIPLPDDDLILEPRTAKTITLEIDDYYFRVSYYEGPTKPYKFLITKGQAIEIAESRGLENPVFAKIGHYAPSAIEPVNGTNVVNIAWVVSRLQFEKEGNISSEPSAGAGIVPTVQKPDIVYVDVDSGEVLGTSPVKPFYIGQQETTTTYTGQQQPQQEKLIGQDNLVAFVLAIIIIAIIIGIIYYKVKH